MTSPAPHSFLRLLRLLAALVPGLTFSQAAPAAARSFAFAADAANADRPLVATTDAFSAERGYGFDLGTAPTPDDRPFFFSVAESEGNYRVTVTFGDPARVSDNTVKAESRQLMLEHVVTKPGEFVTRRFVVNVRNAGIPPPEKNAPGGSTVVLNDREQGILRWDEKLTLEFNGSAPHVRTGEHRAPRLPDDLPARRLDRDRPALRTRRELGPDAAAILPTGHRRGESRGIR